VAIPASRLNILNTQWQDGWRVIPQGVVQSPELKRQRNRPIAGGEEKGSMKEGCEYGHKKESKRER